jgi:hypothetical protein
LLGFKDKRFWLAAGALSAFTYLAKGSGLLILPIFVVSVFLYFRRDLISILKNRYFLGFFALFLVVTSPYLIRNVKVYRSPFFNINRHYFWIDEWQEIYKPGFSKNPPTFTSYLKKHPPMEFLGIFIKGLTERSPRLIKEALKPFPFWQKEAAKRLPENVEVRFSCLWAGLVSLLALIGLFYLRDRAGTLTTLVLFVIFYVFVGWYSKMMEVTRFIIPVIPFILLYAARSTVLLFKRLYRLLRVKPVPADSVILTLLFVFFIWLGTSLAINNDWQQVDIDESYEFPKNYYHMLRWIADNVKESEGLFLSNDFQAPLFYFDGINKGAGRTWPKLKDLEALKEYIVANNIKYGILDVGTVTFRFNIFGKYFGFNKDYGLFPIEKIDGFELVSRDPTTPVMYIIYRFKKQDF